MANASNPAPSRCVLLAEDQPGSRDLITLVLSKLGYHVQRATNLASVLQVLEQKVCACALLSSTLPDGSGAEAVRRIRARSARGSAPVIFVLGSEDQELREACLEAGAQAYLVRPVEIERLLRLIKHSAGPREGDPRAREDTDPVIDLDHLFGFTDGDPQLERELAALFLSSTELYLERMRAALDGKEPWHEPAHALKGASANLGARRVASIALSAEQSEPSETKLAALLEAVDDVRRFFEGRSPTR